MTTWVAIEGPCCAGKTTLGNGIRDRLGAERVTILPDYADFLGGGAGMPNPDPASWDAERSALDVLLRVEHERLASYLPDPPPNLVLIDRSVLTLVAHCAGLDHRHPGRSPFAGDAADVVSLDARPRWPQAVLYLDIDSAVQLERNHGKFAADSIFMDSSYNEGFRAHFTRQRAERDRPMVWIDASAPPGDVLDEAMAFLDEYLARPRLDR